MPRAPKLPVFDVEELELIECALGETFTKYETIARAHDEPRKSELLFDAKAMREIFKKVAKPLNVLRARARIVELERQLVAERKKARVR